MPSDLTAAAKRYTADDNQCQMAFLQDAFALADAMAAELSAEPLSFDHLRAMGWEQVSKSSMRRNTEDGILWAVAGLTGDVHLRLDATYISHDATIGQLRSLERLLSPPSRDQAP